MLTHRFRSLRYRLLIPLLVTACGAAAASYWLGECRTEEELQAHVTAETNSDLYAETAEGSFRQDLLYRLSAVHIHLPPLSERLEDIPLLCEHFLQRIGYPPEHCKIDAELVEALQGRPWRGNVRELRNAVEHASVVARGRKLTTRHLD